MGVNHGGRVSKKGLQVQVCLAVLGGCYFVTSEPSLPLGLQR